MEEALKKIVIYALSAIVFTIVICHFLGWEEISSKISEKLAQFVAIFTIAFVFNTHLLPKVFTEYQYEARLFAYMFSFLGAIGVVVGDWSLIFIGLFLPFIIYLLQSWGGEVAKASYEPVKERTKQWVEGKAKRKPTPEEKVDNLVKHLKKECESEIEILTSQMTLVEDEKKEIKRSKEKEAIKEIENHLKILINYFNRVKEKADGGKKAIVESINIYKNLPKTLKLLTTSYKGLISVLAVEKNSSVLKNLSVLDVCIDKVYTILPNLLDELASVGICKVLENPNIDLAFTISQVETFEEFREVLENTKIKVKEEEKILKDILEEKNLLKVVEIWAKTRFDTRKNLEAALEEFEKEKEGLYNKLPQEVRKLIETEPWRRYIG